MGATINPAGNVVTLSTANQAPGDSYVLSISNSIKDIVGRGVLEGSANRLAFSGFETLNKPPIVEYITATDANVVEIEFRDILRPSSVRTGITDVAGSNQFGIEIYDSEDTSKSLDVLGVTILPPGNILQVTTGRQTADKRYRINLENLASYDGTASPSDVNKGFIGYNLQVAQHFAAANFADLNADGRVDFADFTIFSSVYGTIYFGLGENVEAASANASSQAAGAGGPLDSDPDSTVPITSVPAGGNIITN